MTRSRMTSASVGTPIRSCQRLSDLRRFPTYLFLIGIEFSRHALWPSAQLSQLLPKPLAPVKIAGGEFEEQRTVESAPRRKVDVLDAAWRPWPVKTEGMQLVERRVSEHEE